MRLTTGLWFLLSLLSLNTGCSRPFIIMPTGHVNNAVLFEFYEIDGKNALDATITRLAVQEVVADDKWVVMWDVEGSQATRGVTYGVIPRGLRERTVARPLIRGSHYRVIATVSRRLGAGGTSMARFSIDSAGAVLIDKQE